MHEPSWAVVDGQTNPINKKAKLTTALLDAYLAVRSSLYSEPFLKRAQTISFRESLGLAVRSVPQATIV